MLFISSNRWIRVKQDEDVWNRKPLAKVSKKKECSLKLKRKVFLYTLGTICNCRKEVIRNLFIVGTLLITILVGRVPTKKRSEKKMEIKIKRKGKIIKVDNFPESAVPAKIYPPDGFEGIDLTGYPIIFSRIGQESAMKVHKRTGVAVVYQFSRRNGWGEGVILPSNFNSGRTRFYKTDRQEKDDKARKMRIEAENLREEIKANIPEVKSCINTRNGGVNIALKQETFSDWEQLVFSLEEAKASVEKMKPVWEEWNNRALEIYKKHGLKNPGNGNIQIFPSPINKRKTGISFWKEGDDKWFLFKKEGNVWEEEGISDKPPSPY